MSNRSKVFAYTLAIVLGSTGVGAIGFAEGAIGQSVEDKKKEADRLLQQGAPQNSRQLTRLYIDLLKQGIQQYQSGEFEAAIQTWEYLPKFSFSSSFSFLREELPLELLGNAYLALNKYGKAIEYYEKSLMIARQKSNFIGEGRSSSGLGSAYFYMGDYTKAIKYYERYLEIVQSLKEKLKKGTAVGDLGLDYPQGEGIALSNLGMAHKALGNYDTAINYYEKSLFSTRERRDLPGEEKMLLDIGDFYQDIGRYHKAIESYEKSLEIAR
ncbi:MAG: tetratricopeptide repeat protein, partial [Synechococcales bacterium]|nr:tetratricopeptide repeat protein [Synechococcales bacterium]